MELTDFELLVAKSRYLINSRPISYKASLRETKDVELPTVITLNCKGTEIIAINVIPNFKEDSAKDPDWLESGSSKRIQEDFEKLNKVRDNLIKNYNNEFFNTLVDQAVDKNNRYKPVKHNKLRVNDIVLLKEPLLKANQFPMARVNQSFSKFNR